MSEFQDTMDVECLRCGQDMITDKFRGVDDNITCEHCGAVHFLDTDWDDDGNEFWFVAGLIE